MKDAFIQFRKKVFVSHVQQAGHSIVPLDVFFQRIRSYKGNFKAFLNQVFVCSGANQLMSW